MTHQVRTEIKKGLTQATARATLLGRGGQQPGAEPFTPNQRQEWRILLPKAPLGSVCILFLNASDRHIPPRLAALPALASCSDTAEFSQATSGVSSEDESKASIPCLIRRDAAAWL